MASNVNQMIEVLSQQIGLNFPTAKLCGRYARESGLLSQAGHGRGAARATPKDGAAMLIGLVLCSFPREMPRYILDFGYLRLEQKFADALYLGKYKPALTLLAAITDIITWLGDEEFAAAAMESVDEPSDWNIPDVEITFNDSHLSAKVRIGSIECEYVHESISAWRSPHHDKLYPEEVESQIDRKMFAARNYYHGITSFKIVGSDVLQPLAAAVNGVDFGELYTAVAFPDLPKQVKL